MTEISNQELMRACVRNGDLAEVQNLIRRSPDLLQCRGIAGVSILHDAAAFGHVNLCSYLIEQGIPIEWPEPLSSPLEPAVRLGKLETASFLLQHGANPNKGRCLFSVIRNEYGNGRELFELLIKYKIDLNRVFAMFGNAANAMSALDYAGDGPFASLLSKAGAKTAKEILAENPNKKIEGADAKP